jgi:hypothetical protein
MGVAISLILAKKPVFCCHFQAGLEIETTGCSIGTGSAYVACIIFMLLCSSCYNEEYPNLMAVGMSG